LKEKEINLPGNALEMLFMRPKCLGGVVAMRKPVKTIDKHFWELALRIENTNAKWYHCQRHCFTIKEMKKPPMKYAIRLIEDYLEDNGKKNFAPAFVSDVNLTLKGYMNEDGKILVIIPARTNKFLPSLLKSIGAIDKNFEFVLCHHCPDGVDKNVEKTWFDAGFKESNIMYFRKEFNFSGMNNEAFKKFGNDCKYVILCNDDIVLEEYALESLISAFKWDNNVGIVGAKLLYPKMDDDKKINKNNWFEEKRKLQHCGVVLLRDKRCTHIYHKQNGNKLSQNFFKKYPAVTFGLVAIDAECYEAVLLKDSYPNDLNDIDFCLRARKLGFEVLYNPYAVAIHYETVTRSEFKIAEDFPSRQQFKKDWKDILHNQMSTPELYAWQRHHW
jgi:GT2 family glycosyltransferase